MTKSRLFNRNFTLMVIGQVISLLGNSVLRFTLSVFVLDLTGSAAAFAGISAISIIPTLLLSPIGGVLADRASRKGIMAVLDFVTAGLLIAFAFISGNSPSIVAIAVVLVLLSVIQSFYQPAVQSSIPALVDSAQLMTANGIVSQVYAVSGLIGPIVGGFLYGIFGVFPILYVGAVSFFLSAVMECFLHIPYEKRALIGSPVKTIKDDFKESIHFLVKEQRGLLKMLFILAGINVFISSMVVIGLPYLIKIYLGLSSQHYGIAEGAMGIGSIIGGLLAGLAAKKLRYKQAYIYFIICGGATIFMGLAVITDSAPYISFIIILISMAVMMCFNTLFSIAGQTVIQKLTPPTMLGKVMSVVMVVSMCALPIGQAVYGILFDWAGPLSFIVVLISALICIVLGAASKGILNKMSALDDPM